MKVGLVDEAFLRAMSSSAAAGEMLLSFFICGLVPPHSSKLNYLLAVKPNVSIGIGGTIIYGHIRFD